MGRLTKRIKTEFPSGIEEGIELNSEWGKMSVYTDYEYYDLAEKLAHYEDLEEAGRLIELPCALDTEVYFITQKSDGTYEMATMHLATYDQCINIGQHIGEKWLFLTKEEAERKLKELKND